MNIVTSRKTLGNLTKGWQSVILCVPETGGYFSLFNFGSKTKSLAAVRHEIVLEKSVRRSQKNLTPTTRHRPDCVDDVEGEVFAFFCNRDEKNMYETFKRDWG